MDAQPIVGRDAELALLDAALEALDGGAPGCISIEGEPGIGKTRLLRELRDRADTRGRLVLTGSAAEFERSVPFSVWADTLDAYVAARELELPDGDDLAEILPSLRRAGASPSHVADDRYRAHRAMRGLLDVLARERPLVLALDDLHWSDPASIDLVAALLRRGPDAAVLLVLAFRPGQAPERLAAALASPAVTRISLAPLTERDAALLLGDVDASAIFASAGGNPFYLEQLARVAPHDVAAGEGAGGIPAAVAASLAEELAGLSADERALLQGAAVAGEPFEPDVASAIGELTADAGLDALDALLARDLLRPTTVPRRFRFRHPLVRRAVYDATGGGWRLAAHARAARRARRSRRGCDRARPPRRALGRAGRRARDRAPARSRRGDRGERARRRGALVSGRPAAGAGGGRATARRAARRARRRAALGRPAGVSRDAARGDGPAARPRRRAPRRADRADRGGRALARAPRRRAPAARACVARAPRPLDAGGRGAADRARRRRALHAGLRAGGRHGPRRARGRARRG